MQIKAVFHVDETDKWKLVIANVSNLLQSLDGKLFDIEIVANSDAVVAYQKSNDRFREKFIELSERGVGLCACRKSLKILNISSEDIYEFVNIVPVGVEEIIVKQLDGYAYLKP